MSDYLIKATAYSGQIRAYSCRSTRLADEIRRRHGTWPTATAAMGRAISAGAMMGAMLKSEKDQLTIQIKGNGPLGHIVVDANGKGEVRGYVHHPHVNLPLNEKGKLDVAGAVGREGFIYVIKDLGLKEPYRGSIPIVSGELGEDFTYYFAKSEQTPSAVGLGVIVETDGSVRAAGGFIIQVMPQADDHVIDSIEERISQIDSVSRLIEEGLTPEEMLKNILTDDLKILERRSLYFSCRCSVERVKNMLVSLGREELNDMIKNEQETEIICQFCNEKYVFKKQEIERFLEQLNC
ncbi:Hsp33 family molecular chaperone HslO [Microaerobacter geothermalis]|uniref:Hsp33 family molecular chaperone HslO n=1 Tax=Microaerobacter geothermalis TaxID=674972 RepID=UPI001F1FF962|nr:Hsp33 family molecular chaperone HslO [Microaerobacter geothermalis]MCF6094680.1 Hsp33 family molecular chaperone HslO [Microaerobacter geothermalis]